MKVVISITIDSNLEKELRRRYYKEMLKNVGKDRKSFSRFCEAVIKKGLYAIDMGI